ncbi:hypothetical protein, partial [Pseudomonas fluorescens]|uniref:hypothetical protein n=1 Tax=Pseudomonas fluorescens TaxID=294 RepID=UPI001C834F6E
MEASLLAMTVITDEMWAHLEPCWSWLASDGGLRADRSLADAPGSTVGVGLLAMATSQAPPN